MTYRSDKSEGPTAGTETADPLEFLARVMVHIPDKGHVTTRYYRWYANRPRGMSGKTETVTDAAADSPVPTPLRPTTPPARPLHPGDETGGRSACSGTITSLVTRSSSPCLHGSFFFSTNR